MRLVLCLACLAVLSGFPATAHAEARPAFFEALYDVPIMPGMDEFKDQAMLFDKPDGRIASVMAGSAAVKPADVYGFYGETLPQMGWKKTAKNQYVREGDRLTMEVLTRAPLTIVHFTLSPAAGSGAGR